MIKFIFKTGLVIVFICCATATKAQLIDNSSTFRTINHNSYFRFHYDNDFFTKSDEYYSQGITLDFVHPGIKKFPLSKLLWKPYSTTPQYGITFNLFGYTPTSIASDSILYGDRPFNANISVKTFLIQVDPVKQQQISTAFSIGIMGPNALGYQIQDNIHRWLKNPLPHGWQYQTKNDIILNYQLNYEKQLWSAGNHFLLNGTAEARAGTLNDKLSGGFNFMAGSFNKRFTPVTYKKRKAEYYFYGQSRMNLIGYDASMHGGIFNRKNPYIIPGSDITRVTFEADAGIIVNFKKLYLSYTQSFLTKEFRTGHYHRWGGISVGFAL
ncbi:lipid A deacylase LpxR family protein [Ferruginibacter sp. SUN106]|uniref:lipid A deacylase LpxR family protein n=1 Tax=Ferruginibacter sp. SUN106 TaxID=2978348 RepID=UPI003D36575C